MQIQVNETRKIRDSSVEDHICDLRRLRIISHRSFSCENQMNMS